MYQLKATGSPWGEYVAGISSLTVESFATFPGDAGWTYELHEGRLISMPGPGLEHSFLVARLATLINNFLYAHHLGDAFATGCYNLTLPDTTEELLCPDLSYVLPSRLQRVTMRGPYPVIAPDLVLEVASPNDYRPQVQNKVQIYLQAGVKLVWVVWPNPQTIDVWQATSLSKPITTLHISDVLDGLDVIPGLLLPLQQVFS